MVPSPLGDDVLRIAGAGVRPQELLVLACAILIMVALDLVMRRSRIGKAMMAVAHSADGEPAWASMSASS